MEFDNTQDVIDSRDIISRIEELKTDIEELKELKEGGDEIDEIELEELEDEWTILKEIEDQCGSEWSYGETLIHEDFFEEYTKELLQDIGDLPHDIPWYIEIDWKVTANNIKMDYREIDFDGETYLTRA